MASRLFVAAFAAALVFALAIGSSPSSVSAHEHRTVAENYEFVVGWNAEPAIGSQPNAVSLRITFFEGGVPEDHDEGGEAEGEGVEGVPVEGAEATLNVEVQTAGGANSLEVPLEPAFGEVGAYESTPIIPTLPGDYTFIFTGTLDGNEINETFTSSPDTFSTVDDPATLAFPEQSDSGDDGDSSASEGDDDDSDSAMMVAIVAAIIAIIAAGIGIFAVVRSRPA